MTASAIEVPRELRAEQGAFLVGGEPLVFHCHHYNLALHKTIEEGLGDAASALFADAAAEVAAAQLSTVLAANPSLTTFAARLGVASELTRAAGFGLVHVDGTSDGGEAHAPRSHYGFSWRMKLGPRPSTVCDYLAGYLAGAFAAAANTPAGSYHAVETECHAVTGGDCRFRIERAKSPRTLPRSVGAGAMPSTPAPPVGATGNVQSAAVTDAVRGMPIAGNEEGLIPAFGVYLTHHFANFYNRISYAFVEELARVSPSLVGPARLALVEAGHICAFNTFGGIGQSAEWEGLIQPQCRDQADWFHGLVAVANALGWGCWRTTELVPGKRAVVDLHASYESNGRLAMYGETDHGSCYLATGGLAGLMNLLWVGDLTQRPTLDEAYYAQIYTQPESFVGEEVRCRAKGDDHCTVVVERRRF
jgi:hypothetical protein